MAGCCAPDRHAGRALSARKPGICPACEQKGKSVSTLTVKSLVREHWRVPISEIFSFCRSPECDVVYFSTEAIFHKMDVKLRVGVKEPGNSVLLCYCFEYTRADVRSDIEQGLKTEILERIRSEVQHGFCACEVKNPAGTCCLGDVHQAIKEIRSQSEATR